MSEHRFVPGDAALVMGGSFLLGQQVEIRRWVDPGDTYHRKDGVGYFLDPSESVGGWAVSDGKQIGVKADHHLMPLRGDHCVPLIKANEVPA